MSCDVIMLHPLPPTGVQERYSLVAPAERSVLASVNMKIETLGNLVHYALEKVSPAVQWTCHVTIYSTLVCMYIWLFFLHIMAGNIEL